LHIALANATLDPMPSDANSKTPPIGRAGKPAVPIKVCVADDDSTSRIMLRLILEKWGYQVVLCSDGHQAFTALSAPDGPRLALLDWMMPGMDGVQTCRRIREEFCNRNYYMILVTARAEDTDVISALRSGADDYVSKPFSPTILQARMEVGIRTLEMQRTISEYATRMQQLADSRAAQLVHADRMASLGLLSASVAHEINNPASFLAVNVQTIQDLWPSVAASLGTSPSESEKSRAAALAEEMPSILREMEDGLSRIRMITSELRSFSRTGQGSTTPLDLGESLRKALRICSIRLNGKVQVRTDLPDDLPKVVADATKLEQVFVNLVMNAADAMDESAERDLSITTIKTNSVIEMRFQDSGPGVPDDKAESLFQPFFTTKAAGKGTGLGLYISRGIIEEFGGTLLLEPPTSRGASFLVTLPFVAEVTP
jgi:C4-dicarboxylate-specific signal transduction histidine kinase